MIFSYSPKTRHSPTPVSRKKRRNKGATSVVSVFLFIIFSTLGLSMLYFTGIYLRISAYKKNAALLDYASENGVKHGFHHLLGLLTQSYFPGLLSQGELEKLWIDSLNQGSGTVQKLIGQTLPLQTDQDWENLRWKSTTDFSLYRMEENEDYFKAVYRTHIFSEGRIDHFKQTGKSSFEASLGVFAGRIPLPSIPFLVDKKLEPEQKENFAEKNHITLIPSPKNLIPPQTVHSEDNLLPKDALPQLQIALRIKLFSPFDLSNRVLRAALGLEESNAPIPEGVYLIQDDLGLGGIYVQGDLEEMVLAIEEEFQVVSFLSDLGCWVLKFSPQKSQTRFITPEETQHFDLYPRGIILVNGKIQSLGGGRMEPSGKAVLVTEEEIPSILQGTNLTIISSGSVSLSSHLIHQGVNWMDKVPYAQYSRSQLNIFATGQDFQSHTATEGKIVIGENAPESLKIQASLTASGKGFSIEGENQTVYLLGSLQASGYSSHENTLSLTHDERLLETHELTQNAPQTAKPVLFLSFFKPVEWKEF
jgi:hypothetical protein